MTALRATDRPVAAWLHDARTAAAGRAGLPTRRDEYWRFTDPARFGVSEGAVPDRTLLAAALEGLVTGPAAGLGIERLADVGGREDHWAADLYGRLEAAAQRPVARPFAARNTAEAQDGAVIEAMSGRHVLVLPTGSGAFLHHLVRVGPQAEVTLLDLGAGGDTVIEVEVADGGRCHHIRQQDGTDTTTGTAHLFARLGAKSVLKSFTLATGGAVVRNEAFVTLAGEGGTVHLAGAFLGGGDAHHDDTVFVDHLGRGCESRQVFKHVLSDAAVGVFQGKIRVARPAQKTDGYQLSQALLLGAEAQFLAKPELEIYADDVRCSHGSTTGAIDPVALFYLRSRGVPRARAEALLVLSFLAAAIAEIEDADIAAAVAADIERRLIPDAAP